MGDRGNADLHLPEGGAAGGQGDRRKEGGAAAEDLAAPVGGVKKDGAGLCLLCGRAINFAIMNE